VQIAKQKKQGSRSCIPHGLLGFVKKVLLGVFFLGFFLGFKFKKFFYKKKVFPDAGNTSYGGPIKQPTSKCHSTNPFYHIFILIHLQVAKAKVVFHKRGGGGG
jgi:hypothetical protein